MPTVNNTLYVLDDEGEPVEIPSQIELCGDCGGKGSKDHPAFSNGITQSEMAEWDSDEREAYFSGAYDVQCPCCKGQRTVLVPDMDRLTPDQRELVERRDTEAAERAQANREIRMEEEAERRFGC